MEKEIKTNNILPCIVPLADITYGLRENIFHQEIQSRKLHILRPYFKRPLGDTSSFEPLPLIINIGGGAWKSSTPWMHTPELTYYANHGYVVASIGYTTINFDIFPAQIEDVKCAIRFLRKNAGKFGIDPNRIALMGDSAGAQLASLAGLTCDRDDFSVGENLEVSEKVDAVVDLYGPTDIEKILNDKDPLYEIFTEYLGNGNAQQAIANAKLASPVNYIHSSAPPFLILHGTADTMINPVQSSIFYKKLIEAGVEADLTWLQGAEHADIDFVQTPVLDMILAFLDKHLKKVN